MAQRRMFSLDIIGSDAFLDMPTSSRELYFQFGMYADDDGFIANPKRIMKTLGVTDDDFKILISKRFILTFESGVIVIKHWKINNYIQSDRYHETKYLQEKRRLFIKENGSYTDRLQNGYRMDTQARARLELGKATKRNFEQKIPTVKKETLDKLRTEVKKIIKRKTI